MKLFSQLIEALRGGLPREKLGCSRTVFSAVSWILTSSGVEKNWAECVSPCWTRYVGLKAMHKTGVGDDRGLSVHESSSKSWRVNKDKELCQKRTQLFSLSLIHPSLGHAASFLSPLRRNVTFFTSWTHANVRSLRHQSDSWRRRRRWLELAETLALSRERNSTMKETTGWQSLSLALSLSSSSSALCVCVIGWGSFSVEVPILQIPVLKGETLLFPLAPFLVVKVDIRSLQKINSSVTIVE